MNAAKLIAELQKLPPDTEVLIYSATYSSHTGGYQTVELMREKTEADPNYGIPGGELVAVLAWDEDVPVPFQFDED